MDIRKATEQDIDAILALNRQIGQLHFEQVPEVFCPPSPEDRAFLLGAIADEARLFCVAVVAGEVAGFLTARIDLNESVPFLSKLPVCRITTVVVDEGLRSRGIGRALIAHGDQWGKPVAPGGDGFQRAGQGPLRATGLQGPVTDHGQVRRIRLQKGPLRALVV